MQEIHGTVMHYPWGTTDAIPDLLGIPTDGRPHAEYWLGAHPVAPSTVDGRPLDQLIAETPSLLRAESPSGSRMPFMMKVLSARHALSIQAHPDADRAAEGFARETASGIAIDDPLRVYKDASAKPEVLIALSEMALLLGFRDARVTAGLFDALGLTQTLETVIGPLTHRSGPAAMQEVLLDVLSLDGERLELVKALLVAAVEHADDPGEAGEFARLVISLDEHFPGDPGILAACLMNRMVLLPGQAVVIPPGTMHADLYGTGIEVMANSDNVVRGGLTPKHIAVDELIGVVDFEATSPVPVSGVPEASGVVRYPVPYPDFRVWRLESSDDQPVTVPGDGVLRIVLVTDGHLTMADAHSSVALERGQAMLLGASDVEVSVAGRGQLFLAACEDQ